MKSSSGIITRIAKGTALAAGAWLVSKAFTDSTNSFQPAGKVALVTGGSRGLGLVLARQLADEGVKVAICGRSEESLSRAAKDLSARTTDLLAVPCDVSDRQQVRAMVQQVRDELGSVDILINNAGVIRVGPMESMTEEDYKVAMNVHYWGPYNLISEVLPYMMDKKDGRIVNIVSIGGRVGIPHLAAYSASKFALSGLSEGMAAELNKYNIKVTTVYPGLMRTGSPRNIDVKGQYRKEYAWFKILDSLPFLSIDVDSAARKIIEAMKKGRKTLTYTIPAKLAVAIHGVAPGVIISAFNMINYLLPGKTDNEQIKKGYESSSRLSESFLTRKTDEAARHTLQQ